MWQNLIVNKNDYQELLIFINYVSWAQFKKKYILNFEIEYK